LPDPAAASGIAALDHAVERNRRLGEWPLHLAEWFSAWQKDCATWSRRLAETPFTRDLHEALGALDLAAAEPTAAELTAAELTAAELTAIDPTAADPGDDDAGSARARRPRPAARFPAARRAEAERSSLESSA
jgi:hypothetical protein